MEKPNTEFHSGCSDNMVSFLALEGILHSKQTDIWENCAAWRQQSLISKNLGITLADDLMDRHWEHHPLIENCPELHKNIFLVVGNEGRNSNIEFPNIDIPRELNANNKMFKETSFQSNQQSYDEFAMSSDVAITKKNEKCQKRTTMENFLQGHMLTKTEQPTFSSARQLLAKQTLIQQDLGERSQRTGSNNLQRQDVRFNFSATKKSLRSLGRVGNISRANFVSPLRNKCITADTDPKSEEKVKSEIVAILSHPALKNIDPKMVELINNEIIHKFKPVDWNEIAGLQYAKSIIKEAVVYPLLRPDIFTGLRRPPKGILLFGPPGTGKTLIGKCIASQSSATFFSISSAALTSKWMGEGEKMVRALFAVAVARQPSVIFIDEIDSLLSHRSENENEGTRRLKTEFLVRVDGAATSEDDRVLIVGATNRPQELDEAVRRRFVKRLYVPLPEKDARAEILTSLLKTVENNLNSSQIEEISLLAEGFSGADIDSLCREASMEPLRSLPAESLITFHKANLRYVNVDDFYSALKKIRPSVSQRDLNQYVEWNKIYGSSF